MTLIGREENAGNTPNAADVAREMDAVLRDLRLSEDLDEKAELQERAYDIGYRALLVDDGPATLYELAPRFDESELFAGSDWADPAKLQPGLVELSLKSREGLGLESCSQLRFLAIAQGDVEHPKVAADEARRFLERVLALNLDSLLPAIPYESVKVGLEGGSEPVQRLFQFIIDQLGADGVMQHLLEESERIMLTRPIKIQRVRRMLDTASRGIQKWRFSEITREAVLLVDALHGPTPLSRAEPDLDAYAELLETMDEPSQLLEADTMSTSMRRTGLVCPHHAVLVRWGNENSKKLLARALGLEQMGRSTLTEHWDLVYQLIDEAVCPATAQCIYGLAKILDHGVMFHPPVIPGLRRLLTLEMLPEVEAELLAGVDHPDPPTPRAVLLAGVINVLGQPRGVDQGHNPTCQSARAISLWAQNDPGFLLKLVADAARGGSIVMHFEGTTIASKDVERGVADELHTELDPISLLLTPHLDRVYWQMSKLALDRPEDEHKWVNPEFHGWWVHRGFDALIDEMTGEITEPERFYRHFYATYHPLYNGGFEMTMPQPAGIVMTNLRGNWVDWHAISIQRVEEDLTGNLRIYFFNPNHDKGQDWGQGIVTSTSDRGELEGESSLPFHQFASRIYVFHYDEAEQGDLSEVPDDEVEQVLKLIRESWGRDFSWADEEQDEEELQ